MNEVTNVTAGKPKISGAIWVAPYGTELPTDTTTELSDAFACLGYCSDAGLTNSPNTENSVIKAWGGDTVLSTITSKDDQFKYTLIESLNVDVLKHVYGSDNVSGDLENGIAIAVNNSELDDVVMVIDMILRNGTAKRICIPCGKVSEVGDVVYNDNDPVGYETTLTCTPDSAGNTHYEYLKSSTEVSA